MYKVKTSKIFEKFLKRQDKDFQKRVSAAIDTISVDPYNNNLDIKPLIDEENCYRLRIGKFRILYEIQKDLILIYFYKADSRGDIYKK